MGTDRAWLDQLAIIHTTMNYQPGPTVNLGIPRIPQRIEPPGKRCDPPATRQNDQCGKGNDKGEEDESAEQEFELLVRDHSSDDVDKGYELKQTEDAYEVDGGGGRGGTGRSVFSPATCFGSRTTHPTRPYVHSS